MTAVLIAPGERFDVIVDFTGLPLGTRVMLGNDANEPFPDGDETALTDLMQIRIETPVPANDPDRSVPAGSLNLPNVPRLNAQAKLPPRDVVLEETMDENDNPLEVKLNGRAFHDPVEDFVKVGSTETWQWVNLTGDAHPMHTHLVTFQVVNRQFLDAHGYEEAWEDYLESERDPALKPDVAFFVKGQPIPPSPEELGYKDTVKTPPGYVTRVRARFSVPRNAKLTSIAGHGSYGKWVYHCHILEHEENDMMRPFEVIP
jgi:spore coat protein A